jgi:uncharacterized protein
MSFWKKLLGRKGSPTALRDAILEGDLEKVSALLRDGANVDSRDAEWPSLHLAVGVGHKDVVKLLLDHSAEVDAKNNEGVTPLYLAAVEGHKDVVKLLLDHGAEVDAKNNEGVTPLYLAAVEGHKDVVKLLLDHGAEVDAKNTEGKSALSRASSGGEEGHLDVVKLLFERGACVNAQNNYGETALISAAKWKNHEIVMSLLDKGADANVKKHDGETALMYASRKGHFNTPANLNTVRALLDNAAEVNATTDDGRTALMWASVGGYIGIAEALLEKGADINPQWKGKTALNLAYDEGHLSIVKMLQDKAGRDTPHGVSAEGLEALLRRDREIVVDLVQMIATMSAESVSQGKGFQEHRLYADVRALGEELNSSGGLSRMQRVGYQMRDFGGKEYLLDLAWDGIGAWRA